MCMYVRISIRNFVGTLKHHTFRISSGIPHPRAERICTAVVSEQIYELMNKEDQTQNIH
jgi:hypothetical protein